MLFLARLTVASLALAATLYPFSSTPALAGTFTSLHNFSGSDGGAPGPVTVDTAGNVYGETIFGGLDCSFGSGQGCGVIYQISNAGQFKVLAKLDGATTGANPEGTPVLSGTTLYGSASAGGAQASVDGGGTIFSLREGGGALTVLHSFGADTSKGLAPTGPMVVNAQHDLFGTTSAGGLYGGAFSIGAGVLFKIEPDGTYVVLHQFDNVTEGFSPAGVIADEAGNLYGILRGIDLYQCATAFKYNVSDASFIFTPIFGTTCGPQIGSVSKSGDIYIGDRGTNNLYLLHPSGSTFVTLSIYTFKSTDLGNLPYGPIKTAFSLLVGTTQSSSLLGAPNAGTLYTLGSHGINILHQFSGAADGKFPSIPTLNRNGTIYGSTQQGGAVPCSVPTYASGGCGGVYSYAP